MRTRITLNTDTFYAMLIGPWYWYKFLLYVCTDIQTYLQSFRGGSRAAATSRMECFVIIVNGFQPLIIITKRSILDVAAAPDPPLEFCLSMIVFNTETRRKLFFWFFLNYLKCFILTVFSNFSTLIKPFSTNVPLMTVCSCHVT